MDLKVREVEGVEVLREVEGMAGVRATGMILETGVVVEDTKTVVMDSRGVIKLGMELGVSTVVGDQEMGI